jgi:hypothetical protein
MPLRAEVTDPWYGGGPRVRRPYYGPLRGAGLRRKGGVDKLTPLAVLASGGFHHPAHSLRQQHVAHSIAWSFLARSVAKGLAILSRSKFEIGK